MTEPGTLELTEPHPCSRIALEWIRAQPSFELLKWRGAFSSCALSDNRLAEVCGETLRRLMEGEPVSDRYIMGLYIAMKQDPTDAQKKKRKIASKGVVE